MAFELTDGRVSSRLISLLVDEPTTFVYCIDMRTKRFVYASRAARRLLGRGPDELCAQDAPPVSEFLVEPNEDGSGEATMGRVLRVRHKDGTLNWLQTREVALETDALGRVTLMLGFGRDVTSRREAARDFGLHKYLLRTLNRLVQQFSVLPVDEDITTSVAEGLAIVAPIVGATRCHLCRIHDRDRLPIKFSVTHEYHAAGLDPVADKFQHIPVNLFPWFFDQIDNGTPVFLGSGREVPESDRRLSLMLTGTSGENFVAFPLVEGGETWGYIGLVPESKDSKIWDDDVIGLLRLVGQVLVNRIKYNEANRELIASEVRWRQTADAAFDLVLLLDPESNVIDASSQRLDLGDSRFLGVHISAIVDSASFRKLRNAISHALSHSDPAEAARDVEIEAPGPSGTLVWYRARVAPRVHGGVVTGVSVFATIIHDQKRAAARIGELNRELEHASRLSVLGQMATEIAHELNQPLQVIASYAEGLRLKLAGHPDPDLAHVTDQVVAAADDAAQTVKNIREFVHHRVVEVRFVSVDDLVRSTLALADPFIRERDVVVVKAVEAQLPAVLVNPAQINHVLLNLIINGIDAAAGEVLLEQIRIQIDCRMDEEADRVQVTVTDNGPGVPADKREAIFRRYVTTKKTGLGVGLASSRDVIQRYGGTLILLDTPGQIGASFQFTLPLAGNVDSIESDTDET